MGRRVWKKKKAEGTREQRGAMGKGKDRKLKSVSSPGKGSPGRRGPGKGRRGEERGQEERVQR